VAGGRVEGGVQDRRLKLTNYFYIYKQTTLNIDQLKKSL